VVTVLPDDNKKYLSTDLLRDEPVRPGLLAPRVSLVACGAYKRVCHTCCDPVDCTQLVRLEDRGEAPVLPFCPRRPC